MQIKCDKCGAVAETIMPETAKTGDMVSGIDGIMSLAEASGEDLATTSDIVTDALTDFGLSPVHGASQRQIRQNPSALWPTAVSRAARQVQPSALL